MIKKYSMSFHLMINALILTNAVIPNYKTISIQNYMKIVYFIKKFFLIIRSFKFFRSIKQSIFIILFLKYLKIRDNQKLDRIQNLEKNYLGVEILWGKSNNKFRKKHTHQEFKPQMRSFVSIQFHQFEYQEWINLTTVVMYIKYQSNRTDFVFKIFKQKEVCILWIL